MQFYLFFANIYSIITVNPLWNLCIYNKRWKRHEERERLYEEKEVIVSHAGRNLCCVHAGRLRIGGTSGCNGDHAGSAQETDRTSGTVKLRVWAEESTYDALNKMIDSFKEEYKGQATLISLWNRMRIPIRVTMCLEMCITQLMCLSLQMTRWLLWRPVVHCIRFRMQTKWKSKCGGRNRRCHSRWYALCISHDCRQWVFLYYNKSTWVIRMSKPLTAFKSSRKKS